MQSTFNQFPTGPGIPIRGTFYPSAGSTHGGLPAVLPKLFAVLIAAAVVHRLSSHSRGGHRSGWSRRREAMAKLHDELHAGSASSAPAGDSPA